MKLNYSELGKIGAKNRWAAKHSLVKISNLISKEKVAIHSYLCGDGYIKIREKGFHYEMSFSFDHLFLAKRVCLLFKKEFNVFPKIHKIKSKIHKGIGLYVVRLSSKPICYHLLSIGEYKSLTWKILDNLSLDLYKEWIKCFFDCEGYVNKYKKQIQIKSINGNGLKDVSKLLTSFQINNKVYGPYDNGLNHNYYYILCIFDIKSVKKYNKLISFYHPEKRKKLSIMCRNL